MTNFVRDCVWRATKGLENGSDPCVRFYRDEALTVNENIAPCNNGSQALGSHCNTPSPPAYTYCSHCPGGDYFIPGIGRLGCGHDNTGYGKRGQVWVR